MYKRTSGSQPFSVHAACSNSDYKRPETVQRITSQADPSLRMCKWIIDVQITSGSRHKRQVPHGRSVSKRLVSVQNTCASSPLRNTIAQATRSRSMCKRLPAIQSTSASQPSIYSCIYLFWFQASKDIYEVCHRLSVG